MRLIRTAGVAMMTDLLELEDDAGARVELARPTAGYHSGHPHSSHLDESYRWRARLYPTGAVALETWVNERHELRWIGEPCDGAAIDEVTGQ